MGTPRVAKINWAVVFHLSPRCLHISEADSDPTSIVSHPAHAKHQGHELCYEILLLSVTLHPSNPGIFIVRPRVQQNVSSAIQLFMASFMGSFVFSDFNPR